MTKPDKRAEIVHAALELIAEQGFHGAPMAMIASRAEVGAGTIYRYFKNKEELIAELFREIEERMVPNITQGYEIDKPIRERFLHISKGMLRYFIINPLDFRYLEQFFNSPFGLAKRRDKILGDGEKKDIYHDLFVEGISQQVIKDLPLPVIFALAFGPLLSVARDHIFNFIELDDTLIESIIEACWDGLKR